MATVTVTFSTPTLEDLVKVSTLDQLEKLKLQPPVKSTVPMVKITYNGTPLMIKGRTEWSEVRYAKLALRNALSTWSLYSWKYPDYYLKHNNMKVSREEARQIEEDLVQTAYTMVKFEPV